MEGNIYFEEEAIHNARIVEATRRAIRRIYQELNPRGMFHIVLLDEIEQELDKAGKHPFREYGPKEFEALYDRGDREGA